MHAVLDIKHGHRDPSVLHVCEQLRGTRHTVNRTDVPLAACQCWLVCWNAFVSKPGCWAAPCHHQLFADYTTYAVMIVPTQAACRRCSATYLRRHHAYTRAPWYGCWSIVTNSRGRRCALQPGKTTLPRWIWCGTSLLRMMTAFAPDTCIDPCYRASAP